MKTIQNDNIKCEGCQYKQEHSNYQWCYMFKNEPDTIPCGQHDMYAEQRKENGRRMVEQFKARQVHGL